MKTAEEWSGRLTAIVLNENLIKQIQFDAWKQGMTDAMMIIGNTQSRLFLNIPEALRVVRLSIGRARDNKKTL